MFDYCTVSESTLNLLKRIQSIPELSELRLVGGTALALQIGHRTSIDLDFFGKWDYPDSLEPLLMDCGKVVVEDIQSRMQFFTIDNVKTDFIFYPYPWITDAIFEDGIKLASMEDIGAMKINAIINRGTKKDFIDVFFLLQRYELTTILDFYRHKYSSANMGTALRSLVYFDDAETMPMPKMLEPFDWNAAKARIIKEVRNIV